MKTLLAVCTAELIFGTFHLRTVAFILSIQTIGVAIAQPRSRYADAGVRTGVLEIGTSFLRITRTTVTFVRVITTVILRVTLPGGRNAAAILTSELGRRTCYICAPDLIRGITTIYERELIGEKLFCLIFFNFEILPLSESHRKLDGMQRPLPQENSRVPQVACLQEAGSSEPSRQSFSESQYQPIENPFNQMKSQRNFC